MAELRVGLRIPSVQAPEMGELRDFVQEAEGLGFESIWAGDHIFHHTDVLAPLDLLSWVAALTTKVQLGTSVINAGHLNPILLAKHAATVDYLSSGRLILGISIGGSPAEYASLGVETRHRVGRLLEGIGLMRRLWREASVEHTGRHFHVENGNLRPKPKQAAGIPIYLAAREDKMLDRVPALADGWIASSHYTIDTFLRGVDRVGDTAASLGRDFGSIGIAKVQDISVHADRDEARIRAAAHWQQYYGPTHDITTSTTFGTVDDCITELQRLKQASSAEVTVIFEPTSFGLTELALLDEVRKGLS